MKFACEYVWTKVLRYVPYAHDAKMALPEALKQAAVDVFMRENSYPKIDVPDYDKYVIHTCLTELADKGYLEFGEVSKDWG